MSLYLVDIHGDIEGDYDILHNFPKNATNGDVIKAMFPNVKVNFFVKEVGVKGLDTYSVFTKKWWKAPYNGVNE